VGLDGEFMIIAFVFFVIINALPRGE